MLPRGVALRAQPQPHTCSAPLKGVLAKGVAIFLEFEGLVVVPAFALVALTGALPRGVDLVLWLKVAEKESIYIYMYRFTYMPVWGERMRLQCLVTYHDQHNTSTYEMTTRA